MIKQYESIAALRADYIKLNCHNSWGQSASWFNNETEEETLRFSALGNTDLVPEAEKLITQLDTEISVPRKIWIPSPAGAFPIIPDYLRGLPANMRRRVEASDDTAPIRIYAITTSSGGVNAATLQKRGVVILALVIALSRIRPISLYQLTIMEGKQDGETLIAAEINTHPLDLATACYVLTSAGFARRLTYNIGWKLNINRNNNIILWPQNYYDDKSNYLDHLTQVFSLGDVKNTLIIKEAYLTDQLLTDPVLWINTQIKKFTQEERENYV